MADKDYWSQFEDVESAKVSNTAPKFKMANQGDKARIHFPFVNPNNKQVALKRVTYFSFTDNVTKSWARFQAPAKDSKAYKVAVQYCGEPLTSFVTPVLQYSTNSTGKVISGIDFKVLTMTLHKTRMQKLKTIQDEYNLSEIDIGVVCNNVDFQNVDFSPLKRCALTDGQVTIKDRGGLEKVVKLEFTRDEVFQQAQEVMKDADLAVAARWSEQQILDFLTGEKADTPAFESVNDEAPSWDTPPNSQPTFDQDDDVF